MFMLNSTEHEFFMLINFKMHRIVGSVTFINIINTTFESLKPKNKSEFFSILVFMSS